MNRSLWIAYPPIEFKDRARSNAFGKWAIELLLVKHSRALEDDEAAG